MHLTIALAVIVIAVLVVAAYFYATNRGTAPGVNIPSGATGSATEAAIGALDQELNAATQNISTSNVESAIASQ